MVPEIHAKLNAAVCTYKACVSRLSLALAALPRGHQQLRLDILGFRFAGKMFGLLSARRVWHRVPSPRVAIYIWMRLDIPTGFGDHIQGQLARQGFAQSEQGFLHVMRFVKGIGMASVVT